MIGKRAESDPLLTDVPQAAGTAEPIGQVDDRHGLFGGVNRADVGDTTKSPGYPLRFGVSAVPLEAIGCYAVHCKRLLSW
jgi:hypothetical protein